MERWLDWTAVNKLNLSVVQLRVINKQLLLLVMKNQEQRDKLLSLPDLSLDGFLVVLSPWTIDFNHKKHTIRRVATRVELPGIDPMVEHLGNRMLCFAQDVKYQDVPNACFNCKRPGHQARQCPLPKQSLPGDAKDTPVVDPEIRSVPPASPVKSASVASSAEASSSDDKGAGSFLVVKSGNGKRSLSNAEVIPTALQNANMFAVLDETGDNSSDPLIPPSKPILPDVSPVQLPADLGDAEANVGDSQKLDSVPGSPSSSPSIPVVSPTPGALVLYSENEHSVGNLGDWADVQDEDVVIPDA
ncbi:hypothetical protein R1sor_006464 [Riccia sorocarpa]|uniref:CCHC-type domain-containing protein n=1 Tax=Riccia sorocarpa TaxID=122646 RepID=A0ABD3HN33_9MARC